MSTYLRELKLAAERGEYEAQFELGVIYASGENCTQDSKLAIKYMTDASKHKTDTAFFCLGLYYTENKLIKPNLQYAFKCYTKSTNLGNIHATYQLGNCYLFGIGTPKDSKKAVDLLTIAANKQQIFAMFLLGKCYYDGIVVPINLKKAIVLFKFAASFGHIEAQYYLGLCYLTIQEENKEEKKDKEKNKENIKNGIKYLTFAANNGNIDAQLKLATLYLLGEQVELDSKKAFNMFKKIESKSEDARSYLAVCYYFGNGTTQDIQKSILYYEGDKNRTAFHAKAFLGLIRKDFKNLKTYFKESENIEGALLNYKYALENEKQHNLCLKLKKTMNVFKEELKEELEEELKEEFKEKLKLDKKIKEELKEVLKEKLKKEEFDDERIDQIAKEYELEFKNITEYDDTYKYATHMFQGYTLAAIENNADAQYKLAICYDQGIGIEKDEELAACLYQIAVDNGSGPWNFTVEDETKADTSFFNKI